MINHNIQSLDLDEQDRGEMVLPSEGNHPSFESNVRQFIILSRRLFSELALNSDLAEDNEIKVRKHNDFENEYFPYFGLTLKFKYRDGDLDDMKDFVEEEGDEFFNAVIQTVRQSNMSRIRGNRAVFVREFNRVSDPILGDVMETKIVVSTSIFYNDYRVTTGFPSNTTELEQVTEDIFKTLDTFWGDQLQIEITPILISDVEMEVDF